MSDHRKERDLVVAEPPAGFKVLSPALNGKNRRTPQIAWGTEYKAWNSRRKIAYLEKLASSMNHAADLLQKERNAQSEVIKHLKLQLAGNNERHAHEITVLHKRFQDFNEGRQSLLRKTVELEEKVDHQVKRIAAMTAELSDGPVD